MDTGDLEYQDKRNALIPVAEKEANHKHGRNWRDHHYKNGGTWAAAWSRTFSEEMDRLWKELGK